MVVDVVAGTAVVVGLAVVGGTVVRATVVAGAGLKTTPGFPAGAGGAGLVGTVDVERTVGAGLDVVVVVEGPGGTDVDGRMTGGWVEDVGWIRVRGGRAIEPADTPVEGEPRLATLTNATALRPAARKRILLIRAALLFPYHQARKRSTGPSRSNAPLVLMPKRKR